MEIYIYIYTDDYYYSPGKSKTRRKRVCQVEIGHASRTRSSLLKERVEGKEWGGEEKGEGVGEGEVCGGVEDRFVRAIFCFSLPTALAEYSRAILGPDVN